MDGLFDEIFGCSQSDGISSLCTVCTAEGKITPALNWCSLCKATFCDSCLLLHGRMPISRYHPIQQLTDGMERRKEHMCKTHTDEKVTLFCRDCKESMCGLCHTRIHFVCKSVIPIEDMIPEVNCKLKAMKEFLVDEIKKRQDRIAKQKSQKKTILEMSSETEKQIKKCSEIAVNIIRTKQCDLLGKLRTIKTINIGTIHSGEVYEEAATEACQTDEESQIPPVETAKTAPHHRQEGYETLTPQTARKDYSSNSTTLTPERTRESDPSETKVICNIEKAALVITKTYLGNIDVIPLGLADLSSSPVLCETINTKTYKDKRDPIVKDILVMNINDIKTVIVTSWNTTIIKSFYTQHNKHYHSVVELDERPNGMTAVEGNQILATAPFSFKIYKVSVYPDLRLSSSISTMISYYGITYLGQSRVAACVRNSIWTCNNESRVDILDLSGHVLKSLQVSGIQSPDYACLTGEGNILLSDIYTKSVVCVSQDGPILSTSKLDEPAGVAGTSSGYALVVDRGADKVMQLNQLGECVKEILTRNEIDDAFGIYLDEDEYLYVATGQFVKVFSFE